MKEERNTNLTGCDVKTAQLIITDTLTHSLQRVQGVSAYRGHLVCTYVLSPKLLNGMGWNLVHQELTITCINLCSYRHNAKHILVRIWSIFRKTINRTKICRGYSKHIPLRSTIFTTIFQYGDCLTKYKDIFILTLCSVTGLSVV